MYDSNQRLIYLGQKLDDLSKKYFNDKKKRELIGEMLKIVEIENSKRKKESKKQQQAQKAKEQQIQKAAQKEIAPIREKNRKKKKKEQVLKTGTE